MLFRKRSIVCSVAIGLMLSGCNESTTATLGDSYNDGAPVQTNFNEQALIANITDNIVSPIIDEFYVQAQTQAVAVAKYCQAVTADTNVANAHASAKDSWRNAMMVWQQIEMMQLNPLIADDGSLRNNIYSWPEVYACGVDFDTMYYRTGEFNGRPYDITERRANRKGLFALEYMLFNTSTDHSCDTSSPPNWDQLTNAQIIQSRCEYATEVAQDVVNSANILKDAWSGADGFIHQLKSAGTSQSSIESVHAAVNLLSDAMFYLDRYTKDGKLATPLGIFANSCGAQACPADVESPYAHHSAENIIGNLRGLDKFFSGDNGIGFVDYLTYVGDQETANSMTTAIAQAITQLEAYQATLSDSLVNDELTVEQSHENVKAITDKLKTDFISSLALELPQTSAGDND